MEDRATTTTATTEPRLLTATETMPEKLERHCAVRTIRRKRDNARRAYDEATREIGRQKDTLLDDISTRLEQRVEETPLFTLRWTLT